MKEVATSSTATTKVYHSCRQYPEHVLKVRIFVNGFKATFTGTVALPTRSVTPQFV